MGEDSTATIVVLVRLPLRLHRMPYVLFYAPWCVLLPLWCENRNLGFLRLRSIVPIRTGLGTRAVLVGSVVAVVVVRNFIGVVIGTGYVLADFCGRLRMINGLELVR